MNTCQASHLETSPKHFAMAIIALFSTFKQTHCTVVTRDSE